MKINSEQLKLITIHVLIYNQNQFDNNEEMKVNEIDKTKR